MNRKYSLLILGCLVVGAFFIPALLSGSNVLAYNERQYDFSDEKEGLNQEHEGTEGTGYYDHYESGIYEDKYGKIFHK